MIFKKELHQGYDKHFLFQRYQKPLLRFANSRIGRAYLNIKEDGGVCKMTPESYHIVKDCVGDRLVVKARFFTGQHFSKKLGPALEAIDIARESFDFKIDLLHFLGLKYNYALPQVHLTVFNPDATHVDGEVFDSGAGRSWADLRAAAGSGAGPTGSTMRVFLDATATTDNWNEMSRMYTLFDTSSLTSSAVISATAYSLYCTVKDAANPWSASFSVVAATPAADTTLANGDYAIAKFGSTKFATDLTYASLTASAFNNWTLNASGLAAISKTGTTKFGCMLSFDVTNSAPTWSSGATFVNTFATYDSGANIPKLDVTYTLPTQGSYRSLLGVGL